MRLSTSDIKTGRRLEVSGTDSLGLIHLLGWFTEFGVLGGSGGCTVWLVGSLFLSQGLNLGPGSESTKF